MASAFTLTKEGNIGYLVFDLLSEKVNKLTSEVMTEFQSILDSIKQDSEIEALIIKSAKPGIFIAGADINEIKDITTIDDARQKVVIGQSILNDLEKLSIPTIAAIQGACMGGGTEFSLACTYRVASDHQKVQIALPEVKLGIIPGFGGTQRLPRLIGLQQSLPLILTGKAVNGKKAYKLRLVDEYFSESFFDQKLEGFAQSILTERGRNKVRKRRRKTGVLTSLLEGNLFGRAVIYSKAKQSILKQTKGLYPAPLAALTAVKKGFSKSFKKGLMIEADEFAKVSITDISKELIQLFFLTESLKKYSGVNQDVEIKNIGQAAVMGAGLMGGGIAWLFSHRQIPTRMKDISWDAIQLGYHSAKKVFDTLVKIRKLKPSQANLEFHHLQGTLTYEGFDKSDIVVEAIVENMEVKKKVLKEMECYVDDETIIASNTSSLSITEMGSALNKPERFIGMHFFSPVNRMPLVEVIPGEKTDDKTIASVVALAKRLKKTPIVVKNCPGFLVNRILIPYVNEAINCVIDGGDIRKIDQYAERFGMPIGPLALADEVGLDVGYKVSKTLEGGYGERMKIPSLFSSLLEDESLKGKKTGKGFYLHHGKRKQPNHHIVALAKIQNSSSNRFLYHDVIDRLILIMVNEAARCIEEKVVSDPAHLDMAMIMGTGFPPFRGGILRYADRIGIEQIVDRLHHLENDYGSRFKPATILESMEKEHRVFYTTT